MGWGQPRLISEYWEWFQYLKREILNHLTHFEIGWGVAKTYFKMLRIISNLILFILQRFWIIALCYIGFIAWKDNNVTCQIYNLFCFVFSYKIIRRQFRMAPRVYKWFCWPHESSIHYLRTGIFFITWALFQIFRISVLFQFRMAPRVYQWSWWPHESII